MPENKLQTVNDGFESEVVYREMRATIEAMTAAEVLAAIPEAQRAVGKGLIRLAMLIDRARQLQVDMSGIEIPHLNLMLKIANGQVCVGAVLRLGHNQGLLELFSRLAMPMQEQVAAMEAVPFVVLKDGDYELKMKRLSEMTYAQAQQVFDGRDGLRDQASQIAYLERLASKSGITRIPTSKLSLSRREEQAARRKATAVGVSFEEFCREAINAASGYTP